MQRWLGTFGKDLRKHLASSIFNRNFATDNLHIVILANFALAQPLYHVLARFPEFFVAQRTTPAELALLVAYLSFALPLQFFVLLELLFGLLGRFPRKAVHGLLVIGLVAIIFLPLLKKFPIASETLFFVLAALIGVTLGVVYLRARAMRLFVTMLFPAIFIFPLLFVFDSGMQSLFFPARAPELKTEIRIGNPAPIVMVVFDELGLAALQDEDGKIDRVLFPNFAGLAEDALWFRNATTVSTWTGRALPAMVTGRRALGVSGPPALDHYPKNLFTLLAGTYRFNVHESISSLCPEAVCLESRGPRKTYLQAYHLVSDVAVVLAHVLLPEQTWLPGISQDWKNFRGPSKIVKFNPLFPRGGGGRVPAASHDTRKKDFRKFVARIGAQERAQLNFLHILLPHVPYTYMPSGKTYRDSEKIEGLKDEKWNHDKWAVNLGVQRYFMQIAFTDKLLGELIGKLKASGVYDRALIIVTADHGVSIRPGDMRRALTRTNYPDLLRVPLFIKLPGQKKGAASSLNVESIDILPTIAEVLEMQLPFPVDGQSLVGGKFSQRAQRWVHDHGGQFKKNFPSKRKLLAFPLDLPRNNSILEKKRTLFGAPDDPQRIYALGPYQHLIGRAPGQTPSDFSIGFSYELDRPDLFSNVDPGSEQFPNPVSGTIRTNIGAKKSVPLALAVNGKIRVVGRTFESAKGGKLRFAFYVPEDVFLPGENKLELFLISESRRKGIALARARPLP